MEPWKEAEITFENTMAGTYDFHYYSSPISQAHLKKFLSLVRKYAVRDQFVLDLGGGTGALTQHLLNRKFRRLITVDISTGMLKEAKKKVPMITAVACDGEHLPFKDETFRTVVCSSVLHHLPFPDRILEEVKRILDPYGVVIAQEPNKEQCLSKPQFAGPSGICMGLMHYLYRLEEYTPVQEPPIHEYHRAFSRQELVELFSSRFFVLDFRSRFAFSNLFNKLRNPILAQAMLSVDWILRRNEGSVFHIVGSKVGMGHRNLLKCYFQYLDQLRKDPDQKMSGLFVPSLLPLIVIGRIYEFYERVRSKLGRSID